MPRPSSLRKVTLRAPRVPLQWQLAKAQIDAGDAEAGLKSFEAVLAITPDDGAARYWAFFAAARAENWDDAEKHAAEYATRDAASMADTIRSLPEPYRTDLTGTVRYLADRAFSKADARRAATSIASSRSLQTPPTLGTTTRSCAARRACSIARLKGTSVRLKSNQTHHSYSTTAP